MDTPTIAPAPEKPKQKQKQDKSIRFAQIRAGAVIANAMPKRMELKEVARIMGLSCTSVKNIECIALEKIARRVREIARLDAEQRAEAREGLINSFSYDT